MNKRLSRRLPNISRRAKVKSDKPAYKEKKKTDKGYVWLYDEKHVEKRWKEKKEKLKNLEKNLEKVRSKYQADLTADDDKTRAVAAIVGIMDDTAMRIGNEDSAKEGTFGATTLKVKHVKGGTGNMTFDFPGKGAIEQNVVLKNNKVIKVIRDLMKGKKADDFIFEIDGKKIWDRTVNRYLKEFGISAKDLRGFHANRLMKEQLKNKSFTDALEEVAEIVGHEAATLKNQYLDPELVEKHEGKEKAEKEKSKEKGKKDKKKKAGLSIRANEPISTIGPMTGMEGVTEPITFTPEESKKMVRPNATDPLAAAPAVDTQHNVGNVHPRARVSPMLVTAWQILAPFLPSGARLRNSNRTFREQKMIIRNYWANKRWRTKNNNREQYGVSAGTGFFATMFPDIATIDGGADVRDIPEAELKKARDFMTQSYDASMKVDFAGKSRSVWQANGPLRKLKIAWDGSKHIGGNAIDIDSVPLKQIEEAVQYVMNEPSLAPYITVAGTAYEPDQGNFHVTITNAAPIPAEVHESALRNRLHGYPLMSMVSTQSAKQPLFSKRAELTPEDQAWVESLKGTSSPKSMGTIDLSKDQKKSMRISQRANVTPLVLAAWRSIAPFLPRGARLTSGFRSETAQLKTLNNYWTKYTGSSLPAELLDDSQEALERNYPKLRYVSRILKQRYGLVVGAPLQGAKRGRKYRHGLGNSMDISGAPLQEIAAIVKSVSKHPQIPVKIKGLLIENANNAVHVNVESAQYDEQAVAAVFRGTRYASKSEKNYKMSQREDQLTSDLYEDLLLSAAPVDVLRSFEHGLGIKTAENEEDDYAMCASDGFDLEDMGMGAEDDIGDWFEKSPMFRWREDIPEHDIHNVDEAEAKKLADDDPEKFFYRGLHKDYPGLEAVALKGMIKDNAKFFFIFLYHEREEDEFTNLTEEAAEALSLQDARAFFYYHLHHKFPELGRGAIVQLIDTNPDSFFDLGLQKDYPDLEESAGAARNIKDPHKVELEQPEWLKVDSEKPINSISERDRRLSLRANVEYLSGIPEDIDGEIQKLPGAFPSEAEKGLSSGQIDISPGIVLMWSYFDRTKVHTGERGRGYVALARLQYEDESSRGFTQYITAFEFESNEPHETLGKLNGFLSSPSLREDMLGKIEEKEKKEEEGLAEVIPLFPKESNIHLLSKLAKKEKKDKPKAGVFMKLPKELAKQFPSLGEHDDSVPHVTTLFIGLVPEEHEILLEEVVRRVAMEHDPFVLALDQKVSYFPATKHSDDCKIAKMSIISAGLQKLHKALKKAITNAKMDIDDHFPGYKPHVTLEYMAPPKEKYDTDIPIGSWTADKIEIWNGDKRAVIPLGRKKKASMSVRDDGLSANKRALSVRSIERDKDFMQHLNPEKKYIYE